MEMEKLIGKRVCVCAHVHVCVCVCVCVFVIAPYINP